MPDDTKWVNLFDAVREKLRIIIKKENIGKLLADYSEYSSFRSDFFSLFGESLKKETFEKNSCLGEFMKAHTYLAAQNSDRAKNINTIARKVKLDIDEVSSTYDLKELMDKVMKAYPLIDLMDISKARGGYYYSSDTDKRTKNFHHIMDYIKMVDKTKKVKP